MAVLVLLVATAIGELSTNLAIQKKMNPNNKKVESETYVDASGNAVIADDKGYATVKYTYVTGNRIGKTEYLDASGKLINNIDGYAQKICVYGIGGLKEEEYLDASGKRVNGPDGYAFQETKYIYGKHVSTWQYDADGNPANLHRISEHGDKNRPSLITKDGWYDVDGNPAAGPDGYAWVDYTYRGTRLIKEAYYTADETLFFNAKKGYAVKEDVYSYSTFLGTNYYGADGELTAGPDGYARVVYSSHKLSGNKSTRVMYYNADGSLFFTDKGYCGIEQSKTRYGYVAEEVYYVGKDDRGPCNDGYSRVTWNYTRSGRVTIQCFYDNNNHLVVSQKEGYAVIKNDYSGNRVTRTEYLDENKKPTLGPDGAYVVAYKYDTQDLRYLRKTTYYAET